MTGSKMTIHKIVNDPDQHMAVVHASGSAETAFDTPYRNEYAFFLMFDEAGEKVVRIEEFVDSRFATGFMEKLQHFLSSQP